MFKKLFGSKPEKETPEQVEKMDLTTDEKLLYSFFRGNWQSFRIS